MPRAKRPLGELHPNEQPLAQTVSEAQKPKRQRTNAKTQFEQSSFAGRYAYACIGKPPWAESEDDGEEADLQQNILVHKKPSSEHPDWKWIMLLESFELLDVAYRDADNRDPDRFGMYVYNDFFGYGLIEVLENMLRAFNKEMKPQAGKKYNYQQMWAVVTTLANFLNRDVSVPWMMVDDNERCERLTAMFGCVILTALNKLDRIGQLKKDSRFMDLGHVMALFYLWSKGARSTNIEYPTFTLDSDGEEPEATESDVVDWAETLVAYAEKASIDLSMQGVSGIRKGLIGGDLQGIAKVERWKWTSLLRAYREDYLYRPTILSLSSDNIGGDHYDLLKWTRKERAEHAFDKKDPLADFTDDQIAAGEVEL